MEEKLALIKEKINNLNQAAKSYYQDSKEIMSNFEYDKLYDELLELEKETGILLSNSPTVNVGYEALGELQKERHSSRMLSLDKTKDVLTLKSWLGNESGLLSWKLDGLTVVLTYNNGRLEKAVTRGSGEVGEVITNNARVFKNIPLEIKYMGELVLRGEAVIKYSDFNLMNNQIEDINAKYKNPRNLCSGSVRQLNNKVTASRNVHFFAFSLVSQVDYEFDNSREEQLKWLESLGFDVIERKLVRQDNIEETVTWFGEKVKTNDLPSDGLVLTYDNIEYGTSLGTTAKFPRDSIAFKWEDEIRETKLIEIEWSASRTGLINPIAIFEPVELEGTTVSRASLHNVSILEALELGVGDSIMVYKANMIIPQIAENITRSGVKDIPSFCPVCKGETLLKQDSDVKLLYCINEECLAKQIKSFTHFVSRDAMNIEGLSDATIEKLIAKGLIKELADLFHVEKYKDVIVTMEGFGEKSYNNLITSIDKARKTSLAKFIYSLGISNIGLSNAKIISKEFDYDIDKVIVAKQEELMTIPGIGDVIAQNFEDFFLKEENIMIVNDLRQEIEIEKEEESKEEQTFAGLNFVITGSVIHYPNRNAIKDVIESKGGKVTGSVTSKTKYLINNDNLSNSSKNKKAKELGVLIISEQEFLNMINEG